MDGVVEPIADVEDELVETGPERADLSIANRKSRTARTPVPANWLPNHESHRCWLPRGLPRLASMTRELATQRVEVSFVGAPPAQQIERASGVSEVEVDGPILRCLVCGSFQPFLEALRGHEVVSLSASPVAAPAPEDASGRRGAKAG